MRSVIAFTKKEITEQMRTGKVLFLGILFILFGIMNPAVAKLTPWLMEQLSDSLAESGMIITEVKVTALDSWMQFYKNIPMALIAFVLLEAGIFTKEYRTGTLVLSLTKGLRRRDVDSLLLAVLRCYLRLYRLLLGQFRRLRPDALGGALVGIWPVGHLPHGAFLHPV